MIDVRPSATLVRDWDLFNLDGSKHYHSTNSTINIDKFSDDPMFDFSEHDDFLENDMFVLN